MRNTKLAMMLWFVAAIILFIAAIVHKDKAAAYIPLGVVFLIFGTANARRLKYKQGEQ